MQQTLVMAIKLNWLDVASTTDQQHNTGAQWAKEQIVGIAKQQQICIKKYIVYIYMHVCCREQQSRAATIYCIAP